MPPSSHSSHTMIMNSNRPQPFYLIPGPYSRFACSLSRPAPLKSIANMPRTPSLEDIDSLPYHALQAEAAKHSIRRNLGAAKLREALKRILGGDPDSADLPPQWFIASARPTPAPAQGKAPQPARATKTNARITAAQKKKATLLAPSSPEASRARRSQHPPSPQAAPAPVTAQSPRPPAPRSSPVSKTPAGSPPRSPLRASARSPAPHASTSQAQAQGSGRTGETSGETTTASTAKFIRAILERGRLRGQLVPPSEYTNAVGAGSEALPAAIRREAQRLGLPRSITQTNIDFISFLIRDTLEELDRGKYVWAVLSASRQPMRQFPRHPPASPSNPVDTTTYHNYGFARSPVNPQTPWPTGAAPAVPGTRGPSPTRPQSRAQSPARPQSRVHSPARPQSRVASPTRPNPSPSPTRQHHSPVRVSTPPAGPFDPPSIDSIDLPRELSRSFATERLNISDPTRSQPALRHADELLESSLSESSEEEAQSRSFVENLLSVETAFLEPSPSVTPSRRKRRAAEDESPTPPSTKKTKLTPAPPSPGPSRPSAPGLAAGPSRSSAPSPSAGPSAGPSGTSAPAPATQSDVSMASSTPSVTPPAPAYNFKPLKFFPTAKKAPAIPPDSPSPATSPECAPSNPTLYGTENHYIDDSTTRFSELLRGSTRLLPSPSTRKSNPSSQNK
ncbi:hypothetical protein PtB15_6B100 [Puccinia triticina]|nr:hypothetical protein PtB15_6B100 [Puccinia triticina]